MIQIIIGIGLLIFALSVFPIVAIFFLSSLFLLRFFSRYPNIELKEYWERHSRVFNLLWITIPLMLSSIIGYFWYIRFCVDLLLPSIPELRIVAALYMASLLVISAFHIRRIRLMELGQNNNDS